MLIDGKLVYIDGQRAISFSKKEIDKMLESINPDEPVRMKIFLEELKQQLKDWDGALNG